MQRDKGFRILIGAFLTMSGFFEKVWMSKHLVKLSVLKTPGVLILLFLCFSPRGLSTNGVPEYINSGISYYEGSKLDTESYKLLCHLRSSYSHWQQLSVKERVRALKAGRKLEEPGWQKICQELKNALKLNPNLELDETQDEPDIVRFFRAARDEILGSADFVGTPLDLFVAKDISASIKGTRDCSISDIEGELRRRLRKQDNANFCSFAESIYGIGYPSNYYESLSEPSVKGKLHVTRFDFLLGRIHAEIKGRDSLGHRRAIVIISDGVQSEFPSDQQYSDGRVPDHVQEQIELFGRLIVNSNSCLERIPIFLLAIGPRGAIVAQHWEIPLSKTGGHAYPVQADSITDQIRRVFQCLGREQVCFQKRWDTEDIETGMIAEEVIIIPTLRYEVTSSTVDPVRFGIEGIVYEVRGDEKKAEFVDRIFPWFRKGALSSTDYVTPELPKSSLYQTEEVYIEMSFRGAETDRMYRIELSLYDDNGIYREIESVYLPKWNDEITIVPNFDKRVRAFVNRPRLLTFDVLPHMLERPSDASMEIILGDLLQRRSVFLGVRSKHSIPMQPDDYRILDPVVKSRKHNSDIVRLEIEPTRLQNIRDVKIEFFPPTDCAVYVNNERTSVLRFDVYVLDGWKYWLDFINNKAYLATIIIIIIAVVISADLICILLLRHPRLKLSIDSGDGQDFQRGNSIIYLGEGGNLNYIKQPDPPCGVSSYLRFRNSLMRIEVKCHGLSKSFRESINQGSKECGSILRIWRIGFAISTTKQYWFDQGDTHNILFSTDKKYLSKCKWIPIVADFYKDGISGATILFAVLILYDMFSMIALNTLAIGTIILSVLMGLVSIFALGVFMVYVVGKVSQSKLKSPFVIKAGTFLHSVFVLLSCLPFFERILVWILKSINR